MNDRPAVTLPDQGLLPCDDDMQALVRGEHGDPFAVLGPHSDGSGLIVRAYLPGAQQVKLLKAHSEDVLATMCSSQFPGFFFARLDDKQSYRLHIYWPEAEQITEDPYSFDNLLGDMDLYLFAQGNHRNLGQCLGAQVCVVDEVPGVRFAVWAPNARRVSVVGSFNNWDGRRHVMRLRYPTGVWEIFIPRLGPGACYKYEILDAGGHLLPLRADPCALATELPPSTASVIAEPLQHTWQDHAWMARRGKVQEIPLSIYEVHTGSWQRDEQNRPLSWSGLAERLIPYVLELNFTHVELMPIMEHPFGGSWGYQPLSQFAPTARHGSPADFAAFVDACHQAGIGVILDWVPAHFPTDAHGLGRFDGTALYEYQHPYEGFHQDWNTYIYNLGRTEVHGFLLASALHWLRDFHVDGLRVDAVASMLYRDYSRKEGEWIPNCYGGRENLEAIDFLRHLNNVVHEEVPGAMVIAEESTAFPGVSQPVCDGGLGFDYKWNMGWMNDSLEYIGEDPLYRTHHHDRLTFGLLYAFSEHFILPISHDEVVHGKRALLDKMPGDRWQKFANLRAYLGFMWGHPGKKLLFMGCEIGQWTEWNHDVPLSWHLLEDPSHQGIRQLVRDLNILYRTLPPLHDQDSQPTGFQWLVGDDRKNSVYAWLRWSRTRQVVLVIANFTPVVHEHYRVGVPFRGAWREVLSTDNCCYGGEGIGNLGSLQTEDCSSHGLATSLVLRLPPLGVIMLHPDSPGEQSLLN